MSTPIVGKISGLRSVEDRCVGIEDTEDDVEHLVGDVGESDEVVLAAINVSLIDLGEEGL